MILKPSPITSLNPLEELCLTLAPELKQMNDLMVKQIHMHSPLIGDITCHLLQAGGKRIRSLLTLGTAKTFGDINSTAIQMAACIEFIHTATLLHDDVVDESLERRGVPTAGALWGNKPAVLVGDFLFSRAFELMVLPNRLDVLHVLSKAASLITEGEVMQLSAHYNLAMPIDDYFKIIDCKTAALFQAATQVGALAGGGNPSEVQAFSHYGFHLGRLFQLMDDYLDYFGTKEALGKNIGDDFREGKVTLPILKIYPLLDPEERRYLEECFSGIKAVHDLDFVRLQTLMKKYAIPNLIIDEAKDMAQKAIEALDGVQPSSLKSTFEGLVTYCQSRCA